MKNSFLTFIFLLFLTFSYAQKKVYEPEFNYENLKEGTYEIKSFSKEFLKEKLPVVKSNIETLNPKNIQIF